MKDEARVCECGGEIYKFWNTPGHIVSKCKKCSYEEIGEYSSDVHGQGFGMFLNTLFEASNLSLKSGGVCEGMANPMIALAQQYNETNKQILRKEVQGGV